MGNCLGSPAPPDYFDLEGARLEQRNTQNLIATSLKAFSLEEIETITKDFHVDNLIRTYFPYFVFKGWINKQTLAPSTPETGMAVAVNKMQPDCFSGNQTEWLEKINHLSKLHHPNLVKLIGYRLENVWDKFSPYHWYLVSTFPRRGNLDNYLYGREGTRALSWEKRMKVAIGAAKGLSFLHDAQLQVIYRYLDATNVLLDDDYTPKLSAYLSTQVRDIQGYALTRYLSPGYSSQGYAAPEFVDTGCVSTNNDVYSFGVLLLALLTGKQGMTIYDKTLVDWVNSFHNNNILEIMDTNKVMKDYPKETAIAVATLALNCTQFDPSLRPDMSEVLQTLQNSAVRPQKWL